MFKQSIPLLLCAACSTVQKAEWTPPSLSAPRAIHAPTQLPAAMVPVQADGLGVWDSEGFRKRFLESYLAETDIEPRITEEEYEPMEKVLEYMTPDEDGRDQVERAKKLLEEERGEKASPVFDYTLGNIYFQEGDHERAATLYEEAISKHSKYRRAWRNLAILRVRQQEFAKAAEAFTSVIQLGGFDADTLGLLGFCHAQLENPVSAETAYRMALLMEPLEKDWQMGLAMSLFKQTRYADAAALTGGLIQQDRSNAELWILQANAFIGQGQALAAAENFEFVERLGKSNFDTLTTLGDIYVNEAMFGPGVDAYLRAMEVDRDGDPARLLRAAKVMTAGGELRESRRLVAGVVSVHSDWMTDEQMIEIKRLEARIASLEQATDLEAQLLREIVAIDPMDGEALIQLGRYYEGQGELEQAEFQFERAAGIPEHEANAKVRHAQMLVRQGEFDEALPLLRRAQQLNHREDVHAFLEQVEYAAKAR